MEDGGEAVDALVEQGLQGLWGHVPAGEAGAAGGDDGVDRAGGDPGQHLGADGGAVVGDDGLADQLMPRAGDPFGQDVAGGVGFLVAGVGDRQDGDADGGAGEAFVDPAAGGGGKGVHGAAPGQARCGAGCLARLSSLKQLSP